MKPPRLIAPHQSGSKPTRSVGWGVEFLNDSRWFNHWRALKIFGMCRMCLSFSLGKSMLKYTTTLSRCRSSWNQWSHFLQEPQRKLPVHAVDAAEQRLIQPGSSKSCLAFTIWVCGQFTSISKHHNLIRVTFSTTGRGLDTNLTPKQISAPSTVNKTPMNEFTNREKSVGCFDDGEAVGGLMVSWRFPTWVSKNTWKNPRITEDIVVMLWSTFCRIFIFQVVCSL